MKQPVAKNYVTLKRGNRFFKLFTSDIRRMTKIQKRILPALPAYENCSKPLSSTDVEEDIEDKVKV
jgi:hypothetical protein